MTANAMEPRLAVALAWVLLGSLGAMAADTNEGGPRVLAVDPLSLVAGATNVLQLRGVLLTTNTTVRLEGQGISWVAEVRSGRKADLPPGLEAREVGDTRLEIAVVVPPEAVALDLRVGPSGSGGASRRLPVVKAGTRIEEREPNGGFREAQAVPAGSVVRGRIQADKDVDVFRVPVRAGRRLVVEILGARGGSLLDPMLFLHDSRTELLTMNDDAAGRDSRLDYRASADGEVFVTVIDAHDRGGDFHGYELSFREEP